MNTLLLRLSGPLQAWGIQSRFGVRDTGREPSKSGVIGLLCAALGRPRSASIDDLAALRFGLRVEREGRLAMDYQTAHNVLQAGGGIKPTDISRRYFLTDAIFLAGLESENIDLLQALDAALRNPVWPLYLGRKAFAPAAPVWLPGNLHRSQTLELTLAAYPYLGRGSPPEKLRLVLEDPRGSLVRPDQPLSFAPRRFGMRRVSVSFVAAPPQVLQEDWDVSFQVGS